MSIYFWCLLKLHESMPFQGENLAHPQSFLKRKYWSLKSWYLSYTSKRNWREATCFLKVIYPVCGAVKKVDHSHRAERRSVWLEALTLNSVWHFLFQRSSKVSRPRLLRRTHWLDGEPKVYTLKSTPCLVIMTRSAFIIYIKDSLQ